MKKLIAILLAVSMIMAFALTASADETSYTATLNVNWEDRESVTITGPGTYTLGVDMTYWGDGSAQYAAITIPDAYAALSSYTASLKVTLGDTVLYDDAYTLNPQYVDDGTGNYVASNNAYIELYANWNSTNLVESLPFGSKLEVTLTLVDPNASTEDDNQDEPASGTPAYLVFKDGDWWPGIDEAADVPVTVNVDGAGTYTLSWDLGGDFYGNAATGSMMTYVEIPGAATELSGLELSSLTITADGVNIPVDLTKVVYGDIEGKGNFRIEIYNEYGSTKSNSPIDLSLLNFSTNLTVTFTLIDPNAETPDETPDKTPEETPDNTNPKDGDTISVFVALMAISACGIAVIGKKKY